MPSAFPATLFFDPRADAGLGVNIRLHGHEV
jgi:hypothetical protein